MSRDDGFLHGDHDTRYLHDPKIRRLRRNAPSEGEGAIRTLLHLSLKDTSWDEGERLTIEDADSPYEATPERIAALREVGLIDAEGCIPEPGWQRWYVPAQQRREAKRAAGRDTAAKRWGDRSPHDGVAELSAEQPAEQVTEPMPVRQAVSQTDIPTVTARERKLLMNEERTVDWAGWDDPAWTPFKTAWESRGFHLPPSKKQREDVLWPIADGHPDDLAKWTAEAPADAKSFDAQSFQVIKHVVREWKAWKANVP